MTVAHNNQEIPEDPGCYFFKDQEGQILYIGKAKNLKKRVSSYFSKSIQEKRIERMLEQAHKIDFIVTRSEVEALILENNLIKQHQPRFNIDLKDAKSYAYIQITKDPFPSIGIARTKKDTKVGELYGPFVSASERNQVLGFIKQNFHLRTCKTLKKKGCLRYHLGTCAAPCRGLVSETEYQYLVKNSDLLLKGKNQDLIRQLREEMAIYSDAKEYEKALIIRDQISAIDHLSQRQYIQRLKRSDEHILNYQISNEIVYLILFTIEKGTLTSKEEYVFSETEEFLDEFIIQYYSSVKPPHELILPKPPDNLVNYYLSDIRGSHVLITIPKQGPKKELLELVTKNIEASFFNKKMRAIELGEALHLKNTPEVIECFDISHFGGEDTVASMVSFHEGRSDKKNYRRYKIRSEKRSDDLASMAEVINRRYTRLIKENRSFPDLIVIDGGKGQLMAAKKELDALKISIPMISIAKGEEIIYTPERSIPLNISKKSPASLLIQEIRDEAHRFAVTYQRKIRRKNMYL